ncbi:threonine synthase [Dehalococcoides mccartyi]|uniref:threonine synthase n=1 Tax=Dehalococcoides mccartyi TaxID=61435 RepID=UPI00098F3FBD|nr:threonine synthase [Dehalococcoides mccartyi]AQU06204.1 threonine synthase [Dehalococcoides mccartyi]AQU07646.1 threonine synthase [Dehalococcoides mccartyi]
MKQGVIEHYRKYLPVTDKTPPLTLGEGDTPLVRCPKLEKELGVGELYFKLEGCNPTGSFKDRGMVMAVAKVIEDGFKAVVCASTGNTSASATAYAAASGLESIIIIPSGKIALGKLAQAIVYGAKIVQIKGNFDQALQIVFKLTEKHKVALVNSVNPYRIEGQKTAAFEIVDALGKAPDYLFIPVGNAGNITAYWKGFKEYHQLGKAASLPKMMGFQAEGAAPIVRGHAIAEPETLATAIRIGNPASWKKAEEARDESVGLIDMVSDAEIMAAYHKMASAGIFGEPASAAPLAGLIKRIKGGQDFSASQIVCVVTGNGLKDSDIAIKGAGGFSETEASLGAVEKVLGW